MGNGKVKYFIGESGFLYVLICFFALGGIAKMYEGRVYSILLKAAENPDQSEHPFIKQLKLKYRSYYQLDYNIHNTDAFIETSLFRYKKGFMRLKRLQTLNNRIMLLCIIISCIGVALSVYYRMDSSWIIYHVVAGAMAVAGLEWLGAQSGNEEKRSMLMISLKDYLENVLVNHIEHSRQKLGRQEMKRLQDMDKNQFPGVIDTDEQGENGKNSGNSAQLIGSQAEHLTAAAKNQEKQEEEKVLEDVFKEFFP